MPNILAVAKREFVSYFNSPIAYLVGAAYLILSGALFFPALFFSGQADLRGFFELAPFWFFIFTPLVTMRLFAEERAQGTLELLLTMPITDWQVVLGKFLASLGLLSVLIGLTVAFPLSVAAIGPLDKGATLAAYVGLVLMAATYAAIGLMTSAFTKNQIIAGVLALFIGFFIFILGQLVPILPSWAAAICNALSINTHFQNIARGVVDTRDVVYYLSMIFGCLLIAQTALESRRWR